MLLFKTFKKCLRYNKHPVKGTQLSAFLPMHTPCDTCDQGTSSPKVSPAAPSTDAHPAIPTGKPVLGSSPWSSHVCSELQATGPSSMPVLFAAGLLHSTVNSEEGFLKDGTRLGSSPVRRAGQRLSLAWALRAPRTEARTRRLRTGKRPPPPPGPPSTHRSPAVCLPGNKAPPLLLPLTEHAGLLKHLRHSGPGHTTPVQLCSQLFTPQSARPLAALALRCSEAVLTQVTVSAPGKRDNER